MAASISDKEKDISGRSHKAITLFNK